LYGVFEVAGNTSLHMQRGDEGDKWKTHGLNVAGEMTVASGKTLSITGNARLQVNDGATLRLEDKAAIERTSSAAFYIKGSLAVAENAEASFVSVNDIHLNYDNGNAGNGSIDVAAGSDLTLSVNKLHSYASAAINVGEDARLDMRDTNNITLSKDTTVNLQSGATLALNHLEFSNKADSGTATLKSGGDAYGLDKANYELRNGHMAFNATSQATVKLKLTQSSVENSCGYLLTLDNAGNTLTGVQATKGNITVRNVDLLDLKKLEIAANKTITAANVVVSELARLEAGATLAGNLELANSATIELGGKVKLDGVLTLQAGLTLDGAVLAAVQGLEVGESYTLFTGVNGLNVQSLQQAVTLYNMRSLAEQTNDAVSYSPLMDGGQVAAADYFSNLKGNSGLVLSYNGTAGTVTITNTQAVPEPTTATLSLLALAGLCARRRR
jgi:MYXO-CTERM domain-containing protein